MTDSEEGSQKAQRPQRSLEEVEQRIRELKGPRKGDLNFGRGMALVVSLGVTVAGTLWGAYTLGNWLDHRYGTAFCTPIALLAGLALAGFAAFRLMKPLMED